MNTISERISSIIRETGLTKTAFSERINVTQSFISRVSSGVSQPSDRTIADICREFNVNEDWLRTGEGEMFLSLTRRDEISSFLGDVLHEEDGSFKERFVSALSRLNPDDWDVIERFMEDVVNGTKKED